MKKIFELRKAYPRIVYDSFDVRLDGDILSVSYRFIQSDKIVYTPVIKFYGCLNLTSARIEILKNIFFNLGMIELISYYKACCSPLIVINCGGLDEFQKSFWKKMFFNGLGEFFYRNGIKINEEDFFNIECEDDIRFPPDETVLSESCIIPVGGGKDSVVTLEILKDTDAIPFILNPIPASERSVKTAGYKYFIRAERKIDPVLLEMNRKGFLNGHTPFSALLAFVSAATALIHGKKHIVLSNEGSANEGNAVLGKINVNHQYSKTFEAECDIRNYFKKYISKELNYFSILRPLNELKIASIFSGFKEHFRSFRSCNVGGREDKWCAKCPKCLFTYIILSPFINAKDMKCIFGSDLYHDTTLEDTFFQLTGLDGIKPFECVGTYEEIRAAVEKVIEISDKTDLPYLLSQYRQRQGSTDPGKFEKLLKCYDDNNNLEGHFKKVLRSSL